MKKKKLKAYLDKRLDKSEIADIKQAAEIEYETLDILREDISKAVIDYMADKNIGFNDFVRETGKTPAQISKIIKGESNLTLSSIAQIYSIMGSHAHIVMGKKKRKV